jgi:UDP-N-acetylmuramoyl-tripeptide--D-alanyl-D-alanine ligase
MNTLTVFDILNATGGRLINGSLQSRISGISTDTRFIKHGDIFFALHGKNFDGHDFISQAICNDAVGGVISDRKKIDNLTLNGSGKFILIEVSDTLRALGDLAKYYRQNLQTKFIAVTGSNGKTTTKEMVYHILKNFKNVSRSRKSFNNFIGVPLTIFEADLTHDYCVVEMGTSAPGEIRRLSYIISPNFTILTNISHTHLEGLGSIEGVANAKAEFIENMDEDGTLITNSDDPWCSQIESRFNGKVINFGFSENAQIKASKVKRNKSGFVFTVNESFTINLPVLGKHNIYNALAAITLCNVIGIRIEDICEGFTDFKLPPMRMERRIFGDIIAINDGYNSSPSSMSAALDEFSQLSAPGRRIFVCGDMLELGKDAERLHKEIGKRVASSRVDILWTVGPFSRYVAEGAIANGMSSENVFSNDTSEETCSLVASQLKSKDTVLIKGSRGMKLERVSRQIENCFSEKKK